MTDDNPTATESNREEATQTEYVEHSDVGVSLIVKLKRGTVTRDQEELMAKVKTRTLAEARDDMDTLRAYLQTSLRTFDRFNPPTRQNRARRVGFSRLQMTGGET